jgi:hypothetical protein
VLFHFVLPDSLMAASRESCSIFIKLFRGKQQLTRGVEARVTIFLLCVKKWEEIQVNAVGNVAE